LRCGSKERREMSVRRLPGFIELFDFEFHFAQLVWNLKENISMGFLNTDYEHEVFLENSSVFSVPETNWVLHALGTVTSAATFVLLAVAPSQSDNPTPLKSVVAPKYPLNEISQSCGT
jgi:hypothetical protein